MTETSASESPPPPPEASPQEPPPPVHAGWAVASLLFFWPLSFSAFSHAFNVYPLWARGDFAGARAASDRVRRLGQLSLWLFGGLLLVFVVVYILLWVALIAYGDFDGPHRFHDFHNMRHDFRD